MRKLLAITMMLLPLAASGCAVFRPKEARVQDVHPQQQERKHEAIEDYERRRNQAELQAARARAEQGDLSGCTTAVENVLKRDPKNRDARLLLADVHLARENPAAAEKLLRTLVHEEPAEPRAQHALALLLESTGRVNEAKPLFEKAATLMPEEPLYALSEPEDQGNSATQTASYDRAVRTDSNVGSNSASLERNAQRDALAALAKTTTGRQRLLQAVGLLEAGDDAAASRVALTALDSEPDNRQLALEFSVYALRTGHAAAATATLTAAAKRFPNSPELLRALGAAHLEGGGLNDAQVVLQQALSLDNANALSYFLLGQVLRQQGKLREAEEAFAQAHRLDRRYPQR